MESYRRDRLTLWEISEKLTGVKYELLKPEAA